MIGRGAAAALRRMRRVMIVLEGFAARAGQLGERAAAMAAGDLADEGLGTELAGRLHRAGIAWRAPSASPKLARAAGPAYQRRMDPAVLALLAVQAAAAATAAPAAPSAAPVAPPAPPTDWPFRFSRDDYPAAAMRNEEQGTVRYRVEIGADGRVARCTITGSSGSAQLDSATCRTVTRWARFAPARDGEGNAVADSREGEVTWRIAGDD